MYNQTNEFVYLKGNVNHNVDLSIVIDRRIRNVWLVQLPEVYPRTLRPTERSPRAQNPDTKSQGTRDTAVWLPFPLCIESMLYVFSFRMVFFYLVATGWIFYTNVLRIQLIDQNEAVEYSMQQIDVDGPSKNKSKCMPEDHQCGTKSMTR